MHDLLDPHFLAHAEADARRRLGAPTERDAARLWRRERELEAPAKGLRGATAATLAATARRLAALAEDLDPTIAPRLRRQPGYQNIKLDLTE